MLRQLIEQYPDSELFASEYAKVSNLPFRRSRFTDLGFSIRFQNTLLQWWFKKLSARTCLVQAAGKYHAQKVDICSGCPKLESLTAGRPMTV
jgi:hypothetical protein